MRTQVTFDCADPHAQARFWAEVLGLEVEDHSAIVQQLVAAGRLPEAEAIDLGGRPAFRDLAASRDPSDTEPRFYFQRVPEGKVAKNRVHIDVHVEPDQMEAERDRLIALGATFVERHDDRGGTALVMRDPEGNEFCLH